MSENQILEIIEKLKELEMRLTKLESFSRINREQTQKKLSIKEFIRSKSPENDVQKTLTIGYYLENHENMECFNLNDIKKSFKEAREKIPKNPSDKIQLNIKKGHLMDFENKKDNLKSYVLTNSGEKYVENDFEE